MTKIIFMGTPDFSVPVLKGLIDNYEVIGVVTQPDKLIGRKQELAFSPIKKIAIDNNIKVLQPNKIRKEYDEIIELKPDIIVTCAYGQIIPKEILECPKYGCINVHASLLPKYRGGAPIHRAIINGETVTGITIMYMDEGMDSGDIIAQKEIKISEEATVGEIHDELSLLGRDLLLETLPLIIEGKNKRIKQDITKVTFANIIKREDELLDFNDTSINIYNKIRGLSPYPCSYALLDGKNVKIYKAKLGKERSNGLPGEILDATKEGISVKTKDGEIIITELKIEGKKQMMVCDFLNGVDKSTLIGKNFTKE
jgi:methionyl-tRNA formyltransferase